MPGHQSGAPLIDPALLPSRALIDSGVFLRFLGHRPQDAETPICVALCRAMIASKRDLLVAAPTLAEVTRKSGDKIPRTHGVTVVPFDDRAAEVLALRMPMARLHELKTDSRTMTYLKYDSMIVACAVRGRADVIVTLDRDLAKLAKGLIRVEHPSDFESKQTRFPFELDPPKEPPRAATPAK